MTGVVIDVATSSASTANSDLAELNRSLTKLLQNAVKSQAAMNSVQGTGFKEVNKNLKESLRGFSSFQNVGVSAAKATTKEVDKLGDSLSNLKRLALSVGTTFAAFYTASYFSRSADDLTRIQNRLALINTSTKDVLKNQQRLYTISTDTRSAFAGTADLFVDFTRVLETTGASQQKVLGVVKTIQQASALSGSSADSTKAAITQLTQGISAGALRGEELNSVMEQMKYLSIGLQRTLGMNAGQLRKFAEDGNLTTAVLVDAIQRMQTQTSQDFAKTSTTGEQAINRIQSAISYLVGDMTKFYGIADNFSRRLLLTATGIDRLGASLYTGLFTLRENFRNYVNQFNLFDAASLTIRAALRLEISPLEALDKYEQYKEIKSTIARFTKFLNKDKPEIRVAAVAKPDVDFNVDGVAESAKEKTLVAAFDIKAALRVVGAGVYELGRAAFITVNNLVDLLPVVGLPVETFAIAIQKKIANLKATVDSLIYTSLMPFARTLEGIGETIYAFSISDTRLERAWVDVFKSDSLKAFTENLRDLNDARASLKMSDTALATSEAEKVFKDITSTIDEFLISLDLMDNRLLSVRYSNLDRVRRYFADIYLVTKRIYDDVVAPAVAPLLARAANSVRAVLRSIGDAISDFFTADVGHKIGVGIANTAVLFIDFFAAVARKLTAEKKTSWGDLFSTEDLASSAVKGLSKAAKAIYEFFKGVFSGIKDGLTDTYREYSKLFRRSITDMVSGIRESLEQAYITYEAAFYRRVFGLMFSNPEMFGTYVMKLYERIHKSLNNLKVDIILDWDESVLQTAVLYMVTMVQKMLLVTTVGLAHVERVIAKFCNSVKGMFFNVYDAVVGHSYWPDMIDGVVGYTSNLFKSKNTIQSFVDYVSYTFSKLAEQVAGSDIGKAFGLLFERLGNINLSDVFKSLANNFTTTSLALFTLIFGTNGMKLAAASYFLSVINLALDDALSVLSPLVGQAAGAIAATAADHFAKGLISAVELFIVAAPKFVTGFTSAFVPVIGTLTDAISAVPLLGNLLINDLYAPLLLAAGAFALFTKNGAGVLSKLVMGTPEKKGKNGKVTPGQEGIVDYFRAVFPKKESVGSDILSLLLPHKKLAIAGAAILSTALFESISLVDAASLGLPLLAFAFFGKDAGGRIVRDSLAFVNRLMSDVYNKAAEKVISPSGKDGLLGRIFLPQRADVQAVKSKIAVAFDELSVETLLAMRRMRANTAAYAAGNMSFTEMFTKDANFVGPVAPGTKSRLSSAMSSLFSEIGGSKIGSRSISEMMSGATTALKDGIQKLKRVYASSNLKETFLGLATQVTSSIAGAVKTAMGVMVDGVSVLLSILKNRLVLFGVLAAGVATYATAASDAATATSTLASALAHLAIPVAAIAALGVAAKLVKVYNRGRDDFVNSLIPKEFQDKRAAQMKEQASELEAFTKDISKRQRDEFNKNLAVELAGLRKKSAAEIAAKLKANPKLSSEALYKLSQAELEAVKIKRTDAFEANLKKLNAARDATFANKWAAILAADRLDFGSGKEGLARQAGLSAVTARLKEMSGSLARSVMAFGATTGAAIAAAGGIGSFVLGLFGANSALKTFIFSSVLTEARLLRLRLSFAHLKLAMMALSSGNVLKSVGSLGNAVKDGFFPAIGAIKDLLKGGGKGALGTLTGAGKNIGKALSGVGGSLKGIGGVALKALWPLVKLPLLFTVGGVGAGLLGLHFFGPGNSFISNLEWAYDKARSFLGLKPKTAAGRRLGIAENLSTTEVGSYYKTDFKAELNAIDFGRLSGPQTDALFGASQAFKEGIDNLLIEYEKQGFLTAEQIATQKKVEEELKAILLRQPIRDEASVPGGLDALNAQILAVDNSAWAMTKRFVGYSPLLDKVAASTAWFRKALNVTFAALFSWKTFAAASIGFALGGPAGAIAGAIVGLVAELLAQGIGMLAEAAGSWLMAGLKKVVDIDLWVAKSRVFIMQLGDNLAGFTGALQLLFAGPLRIQDKFTELYSEKPSKESKDRAELVSKGTTKVRQYYGFLPAEVQSLITNASETFQLAEAEVKKLERRGYTNIQEKSFEDFDAKLQSAKEARDKAQAQLLLFSQVYGDFGEENSKIAEFTTQMQKLASEAKTLLDLDISKFGETFLGSPKDFEELRRLTETATDLKFRKSRTFDANTRNVFQAEEENLKRQAKELAERVNAEFRFEGLIESRLKLSGLDVAAADLRQLAFTSSEDFSNFMQSALNIGKIKQTIAAALNNKAAPGTVRELYKQLYEEESKARTAGSKTGYDFDKVTKRLQALNLPVVSLNEYLRLSRDEISGLSVDLDKLANKNADIANKIKIGAPFEEYVQDLKDAVKEAERLSIIIQQLKPQDVRAASALGVPLAELYSKPPKVFDRAITKGLTLESLRSRLESDSTDSSLKPSIAREILKLEAEGSRMFEKAGEDIFARFSAAMDKAGATLDLSELVKFSSFEQQASKDIITQMAAIRAKVLQAGSIYPKDSPWFAKQMAMLEALQQRLDAFKETADKSLSGVIDRISESGFEVDLNSAFFVDDSTIERLSSVADQVRATLRNLKDPAFAKSGRELLGKLRGLRQQQFDAKQETANFGDRVSLIKAQLPQLKLEDTALAKLRPELFDRLYEAATDLASRVNSSKDERTGTATAGIEALRKQRTEDFNKTIRETPSLVSFETQFDAVNKLLTDSIDKDLFSKISSAVRQDLYQLAASIEDGESRLSQSTGAEAAGIARQLDFDKKRLSRLMKSTVAPLQPAVALLETQMAMVGMSVDKTLLNLLNPKQLDYYLSTSKDFAERQSDISAILDPGFRAKEQKRFFEDLEGFEEAFRLAIRKPSEMPLNVQAKSFASSLMSSVETSIGDVLKGRASLIGSVRTLVDTFTSNVIDSFVKGFLDSLVGEGSFIDKELRNLSKSLFERGVTMFNDMKTASSEGESGIASSIFSAFSSIASFFGSLLGINSTQAVASQTSTGLLSVISTTFPAAVATSTSAIVAAIGSLSAGMVANGFGSANLSEFFDGAALLAFAKGGRVSGPGSSTSDSILARLSNNEFVVNANATKQYLPLLEAINANRMPKFADGGLVGGSAFIAPVYTPIPAETRAGSSGNTQVIHLTITGDISRQTRKEIYEMLPTIAAGVNQHNREKGR